MIGRRPRLRNLALGMVAGAVAIAGAPAAASAATCTYGPLSTPFAQFGDSASYGLVPGGSFESGAPRWSLSQAAVASGNESFNVAGGSHSLAIQPTGTVMSPAICVSTASPTFRFFARQTSGSWAQMNVVLRWTDAFGAVHDTTTGSLQGSGPAWQVTPAFALSSTLPLWQAGQTLSVRLLFEPAQYGGAWAIDDVYVDPNGRG
jgi:hypothetical protein